MDDEAGNVDEGGDRARRHPAEQAGHSLHAAFRTTPAAAPSHLDPLDPFGLPEPEAAARPRPGGPPHAQRGRAVRAVHLGIRVLASERARLAAAAKRAGYRDTSSWCRGTLIAACDGEAPPLLDGGMLAEVARLRRDLNSGLGANLNQALLHANARAKGGLTVDGDALAVAVAAAQAALEVLRIDMGRLLGPRGRA